MNFNLLLPITILTVLSSPYCYSIEPKLLGTLKSFLSSPPIVEEVVWCEIDNLTGERCYISRYQSNCFYLRQIASHTNSMDILLKSDALFIVKYENEYWSQNPLDSGVPSFDHWVDDGKPVGENDAPDFKRNTLLSRSKVNVGILANLLNLGILSLPPRSVNLQDDGGFQVSHIAGTESLKVPLDVAGRFIESSNGIVSIVQHRTARGNTVILTNELSSFVEPGSGHWFPERITIRNTKSQVVKEFVVRTVKLSTSPLARAHYTPEGLLQTNRAPVVELTRQGFQYTNAFGKIIALKSEPAQEFPWPKIFIVSNVFLFLAVGTYIWYRTKPTIKKSTLKKGESNAV